MAIRRDMKSTLFKVLTGFIIGATAVGGYAIAVPSNVPVVKADVDVA
jgi:putative serine protease PepD